ncbi:MAG: hypothetical protein QM608_00160 [Caulobacter sp.]
MGFFRTHWALLATEPTQPSPPPPAAEIPPSEPAPPPPRENPAAV